MTLSSYFLGLSVLLGSLVLVFAVSHAILRFRSQWQTSGLRALRARIRNGSVYQQSSSFPTRLAR